MERETREPGKSADKRWVFPQSGIARFFFYTIIDLISKSNLLCNNNIEEFSHFFIFLLDKCTNVQYIQVGRLESLEV